MFAPRAMGERRDHRVLLGRRFSRGDVWPRYLHEHQRFGHLTHSSWVEPSLPPLENFPMARLPVLPAPSIATGAAATLSFVRPGGDRTMPGVSPFPSSTRWLVAGLVTCAALSGCAREPITTSTGGSAVPASPGQGSTVTTRAGTSTTESTTTTVAPGTTVVPAGGDGTTRVFQVDADLAIDAEVGESFELHIEELPDSGFTWKAGQVGESVRVTGATTNPSPGPGEPAIVVGVYTAEAPGESVITFSAATADGTPGDQWRVTVTVT